MMGFEPWETTIRLQAGATESISAALEPRETAPPPSEPVTSKITEGDLVERGPDVVDPKCIDCPEVRYPEGARRADSRVRCKSVSLSTRPERCRTLSWKSPEVMCSIKKWSRPSDHGSMSRRPRTAFESRSVCRNGSRSGEGIDRW